MRGDQAHLAAHVDGRLEAVLSEQGLTGAQRLAQGRSGCPLRRRRRGIAEKPQRHPKLILRASGGGDERLQVFWRATALDDPLALLRDDHQGARHGVVQLAHQPLPLQHQRRLPLDLMGAVEPVEGVADKADQQQQNSPDHTSEQRFRQARRIVGGDRGQERPVPDHHHPLTTHQPPHARAEERNQGRVLAHRRPGRRNGQVGQQAECEQRASDPRIPAGERCGDERAPIQKESGLGLVKTEVEDDGQRHQDRRRNQLEPSGGKQPGDRSTRRERRLVDDSHVRLLRCEQGRSVNLSRT